MFLENKSSGGGDAIEYKLDDKGRRLKMTYGRSLYKKRVLQKRHLTFLSYKLTANEPYDPAAFLVNNKTLLLRNFCDQEDMTAVQMYAENLVVNDNEDNDIEAIQKSR